MLYCFMRSTGLICWTVQSTEIIDKVDDDTMVALTQFDAPMGVTNREFLVVRCHETLPDGA